MFQGNDKHHSNCDGVPDNWIAGLMEIQVIFITPLLHYNYYPILNQIMQVQIINIHYTVFL